MSDIVTLKIPQLDNWRFSHLQISEGIGDYLPVGKLSFIQEPKYQNLNIESLDISMILNNQYQLDTKAFVMGASNRNGDNYWDLIFIPKSFYYDCISQDYNGIHGLIRNLCPYDIINSYRNECKLNGVKIYQNNVTGYSFLTRYLRALALNQLYSFRIDGLYFTDLNNPTLKQINIPAFSRHIPLTVKRNKLATLKADSYELKANNLTNVHFNNSLIGMSSIMAPAYKIYLENQKIYKRLEDTVGSEFPTFMNLRAGDCIKILGSDYENNNYVITKNDLDITTGKCINRLIFSAI